MSVLLLWCIGHNRWCDICNRFLMLVSHVQTRFLNMHVLRDYVYRCTWILTLMKPNAYPHACTMHDNTASGIKPGPSLAVLHTLQASGVARFCVCVSVCVWCMCVHGVCVWCMYMCAYGAWWVYANGVCVSCGYGVCGRCMYMCAHGMRIICVWRLYICIRGVCVYGIRDSAKIV